MIFTSIFPSYALVKIVGKNPKRYLNELRLKNINLYNIIYKDKDIFIKISSKDYELLKSIKTSYKFPIIKRYGFEYIKYQLKYHALFFICVLISYLFLLFLSNIIFSIEIVHNDKELRNIIYSDLKDYGISKYHFFKSYEDKEKILEKIRNKHKDKIEWIEMTRRGVKYIVNVEPRIIKEEKNNNDLQNIIASKNGVIKKINSSNGEVVKKINDYVNKGDIIISGNITKNEKVKAQTKALGTVYAETWYKSKIRIPAKYKEEFLTGKKKYVVKIYFFNKSISTYPFYKYYKDINIIKMEPSIFPIGISYTKRMEKVIKKYNGKNSRVIDKEINKASKKLETSLNKDEYIIGKKVLKKYQKNSTIEMEVFFKVYENITKTSKLKEMTEEDYKKQEEQE